MEARLSALALALLLALLGLAYYVAFHIARAIAITDFPSLPAYAQKA